ncbi:MAG: hypothetical protein ACLUIX_09595 [Oscillospiraceae bacterium]
MHLAGMAMGRLRVMGLPCGRRKGGAAMRHPMMSVLEQNPCFRR